MGSGLRCDWEGEEGWDAEVCLGEGDVLAGA